MIESIPSPLDTRSELEAVARVIFATYGVRGVQLTMEAGKKTWCSALKTGGIQINIDPDQIAGGKNLTPDIMMAAVGHELGHTIDMLEDPGAAHEERSETDNFFYNLLDDTVIDSRLRRFPRLEQPMTDLYHEVMGSDVTDLTSTPLTNQLMYGMRIGQVLGQQPKVDERVADILTRLNNYTTPDGETVNVIDILTLPSTTLADRRIIADAVIKPLFDELLKQDEQDGRQDEINQAIEDYHQSHDSHGNDSQETESADDSKHNQTEASGKSLPEQIKEAIEQAAKGGGESDMGEDGEEGGGGERDMGEDGGGGERDMGEDGGGGERDMGEDGEEGGEDTNWSEKSSDKQSSENDQNDGEKADIHEEAFSDAAGSLAKEMNLPLPDAENYLRIAQEHQAVIRDVAEVFKQLARPTRGLQRITNARGRSTDGALLHNSSISDLTLQETTGLPAKHIWQKTARRATRETLDFGGLDIHLLIDTSGSMIWENRATDATAAAVCLIEGLNLAKMQIAKANSYQMPDVRTHVVAFGSDAVEVAPLAHKISPPELGQMYSALMQPNAYSTLINEALLACSSTPATRDSIVLIISDGNIFDSEIAVQTINSLPPNTYVAQFIIGDDMNATALTDNTERLADSHELPHKLLLTLQNYTTRYL